jgi:hypothetical protein
MQLSSSFASLFTTGAGSTLLASRVGWVGVAGGLTSLSGDLVKASNQVAKNGSIEMSTIWSLVGDLSGILSGGGLTIIGAAVAAGAATVVLPVVGTVSIATALAIAATAGMVSAVASVAAAISSGTDQPSAEVLSNFTQLNTEVKASELFKDPNAIKALANLMASPNLTESDVAIVSRAMGIVSQGSAQSDEAAKIADGLDTPARNSAIYLTRIDTERVAIGSGGKLSDLWLEERRAGNSFTLDEFANAVMVSKRSLDAVKRNRGLLIV